MGQQLIEDAQAEMVQPTEDDSDADSEDAVADPSNSEEGVETPQKAQGSTGVSTLDSLLLPMSSALGVSPAGALSLVLFLALVVSLGLLCCCCCCRRRVQRSRSQKGPTQLTEMVDAT